MKACYNFGRNKKVITMNPLERAIKGFNKEKVIPLQKNIIILQIFN